MISRVGNQKDYEKPVTGIVHTNNIFIFSKDLAGNHLIGKNRN